MTDRRLIHSGGVLLRTRRASIRWIGGALFLTALVWLLGLAGLLAIANRVHDDVPMALAVKLPLLQSKPELIFAGDSRTHYQVDPVVAAELLGKPAGAAINLGYEAGEPLAVLAAINLKPDAFKHAQLVINLTPPILNDGLRTAGSNPQDVTARMGVGGQMATFLPLRLGTLIRFIREAFQARLGADQDLADWASPPPDFGLIRLQSNPRYKWPSELGSHAFYAGWDLSGPKVKYEFGALCDIVGRVKSLTVVSPPWSPRYDRATDPAWAKMDREQVAVMQAAGRRCGFAVLDIPSVPGLTPEHFMDESHLNAAGIPIYTRYLMNLLKRS
ncbi:MAG: hypothetical protein ABWY18_11680 [Tardiphaga sp.]